MCPICVREQRKITAKQIAKDRLMKGSFIRKPWNIIKYKEELLRKFPNIKCIGNYKNSRDKVKHKCVDHGVFIKEPFVLLQSNYGCPECASESRMSNRKRLSEKDIVNRILVKHKGAIKLNKPYIGNTRSAKQEFICDKGHTWNTSIYSVMHLSGCPKCCRSPSFSILEKTWINIMKIKINPNIEENHSIKLKGSRRSIKPDGYDPTTKTIYEFHGDYWHGNIRLYKSRNYKVGKLSMKQLNKRTRKRELNLIREGYTVVYCWEHDFKRYIKSRFKYKKVPRTVAKKSESVYCY